jgi:cytosine/adenosine deaminase-related metal-dependent hydrolase
MDGPPIEDGAIAVSNDRIVDVGKFDEIKARHTGEIADLGEQTLLPGLINAHCHLDYTCLRRKIPSPRPAPGADSCSHGPVGRPGLRESHASSCEPVATRSFTDWIRAINAEKAKLSADDYVASINDGFAEARRFGTTTIANLTAFPELIPRIRASTRTPWFAEMIDIRAPERAKELVDRATECVVRARSPGALWGLAPHALFTASNNVYRCSEEIARTQNALLTTHLAESSEEMQMFYDASGPLYDFLKNIGRPMNDCGNKTPLELFLAATGGRAPSRWIVAHLNELKESDFELLKKSTPKFQIVHCARSHNFFGHGQFRFERLHSLGFNICLGTDSLASNGDLSLFGEMRAFQKMFPSVSPEAILRMVTTNPAMALHQENALGRIRRGFKADLVAVPCSGSTDVFEQIIAFKAPINWLMVDGKVNSR